MEPVAKIFNRGPWRTGGLALGLALLVAGCGGRDRSGRPDSLQSELNVLAGQRLGETVAQEAKPGEVVLVHLSRTPDEARQWQDGLIKGLGGGFSLIEIGPDQLPAEAVGGMGGFPPLAFALQQHPDAAAIISTLPVGAYERPSFPAKHPPLFALAWTYLPDAAHMLDSRQLVAGVFERLGRDASRDMDASLSPDELFERNYVIATPENYRTIATPYAEE